jgi:hypothetical protein
MEREILKAVAWADLILCAVWPWLAWTLAAMLAGLMLYGRWRS